MFLIAGVYFLAVAGLGEGSVYTSVGALLCFVAVALTLKQNLLVTAPWRTASAAFALIIFVAQVIANANSNSSNIYSISSTLLNGAFLLLFAGVLLATSREMMRKSDSEDDEEEEKKPAKKLTYQV